MELLITPREAVEIAWPEADESVVDTIGETTIISAQERYIKPVFGKVYDKLMEGEYTTLAKCYIKPALAYFVKYTKLPATAARATGFGIYRAKGDYFNAAAASEIGQLRKQTRVEADTLLRLAVEHVEKNRDVYSEYDPRENILNKRSISSRIVL